MNLMRRLPILILLVLLAATAYLFYEWRITMSPTDFYGRPALQHYSEFWNYLMAHPECMAPANWGPRLQQLILLLLPIVSLGLVLWLLQGGPFRGRSWRNFLGGRKPVDAPWLYVIIIIPILLGCLAILGVGADLNWYTMDINVNGKIQRVPNPAYSFTAHECANLLIALPAAIFDFGIPQKQKWLAILLIMLICALVWEIKENRDVAAHGQSLEYYNTPDDSEFDVYACISSFTLAFCLYYACWFATATPEKISLMTRKFLHAP